LKIGVHENSVNQTNIVELLGWRISKSSDEQIILNASNKLAHHRARDGRGSAEPLHQDHSRQDEFGHHCRDSGIGTTQNELITNLGTIAMSATKAFKEVMVASDGIPMIEQFRAGLHPDDFVSD